MSAHSWCYDDHCDLSPSQWHLLPDSYCDGERQSPINIDTENVELDESLDSFKFTNFDDKHAIKYITNTGHTVKCVLKDDVVEVSGGGLEHDYSTLQFHFHWGTESQDSEGSEHTVDSKRYPMEVSHASKSSSHLNEAAHPSSSPTSGMEAWKKLTTYLPAVQDINSKFEVTDEISIDDLLGSVNRQSYYRYNGSLTTPSCNEAVVWMVFKESVKVDHDLMMMFPKHAEYHNVYWSAQSLHARKLHTTKASSASSFPGPILLYMLLSCLCVLFR
ncbi:putative carbonic anhydrase 3 isoform X2 [Melanotaenia boesemani]|uniref:putative carbonic anhydrase 3 isoform X2 n=1 Tax=Melanotaenia boesemani TaxID=1250792 RepID=UPI001C058155|nr:putative carbonic anhydrase 3 isoform X2 [Melanotaenia boesemani]